MFKLRTVDVWDTLLRRSSHPEAVKLATAKHIYLRFHDQLLPDITGHWHIHERRNAIETLLAREAENRGDDGEYELGVVLARLLSEITSLENTANAADDCTEYELAFEKANTFPDPGIRDFLKAYPAKRTIFLSDFYMGSQMLRRLLAHHGLDEVVPDGLVSCDLMRNKRSGRLFALVHERYSVAPHEHVHIGDNPYVDVDIPTRLGIRAFSYLPEALHIQRGSREILFSSRSALFEHLRQRTLRETANDAIRRSQSESAAFQLGIQAAPLFIGFSLFIAERSIKDRLTRLFFATREGEFFHRIHAAMFPENKIAGCTLAPANILCVSRQATFAASLSSANANELNRVWSLQKRQKLSTLFSIVGVDPAPFSKLLDQLSLKLDETIFDPFNDKRVLALLETEEFAIAAESTISQRKRMLHAYLCQQGFCRDTKVGLIDIGWRGTIQDNLARICPNVEVVGYYLALRSFLNEQPANVQKFAFGPDERVENAASFFETFEPLELLTASKNGSVSTYRAQPSGIKPVRETNDEENAVFEQFTRHFQDGVVRGAEVFAPLLEQHAVMAEELRELALGIWGKLAACPPTQLLKAYYAAPQHDVFDFGGFVGRDLAPTIGKLLKALFIPEQKSEVIQYVRRTQWSPAIDGLPVSKTNKLALKTVFWLAHRYKRHLMKRVNKND